MTKLIVPLTALTLTVASLAVGPSKTATDTVHVIAAPSPPRQASKVANDPPGAINGAKNPELIPTHVAYSTMFRMLSNRRTAAERNSIRTYVRQIIGLGKQNQCHGCRPSTGVSDTDLDALLAAAEEFHQRVSVLDAQAKEIKDQTWPNPSPEVMARLTALQQEKEEIIAQIAASLPRRLSAGGVERVLRHVNEHVKSHTTLTPTPPSPPGGSSWQHQHHN